jgi:para-nitrobenzyl esterase
MQSSVPWQMMIGAQMSVGGRMAPFLDGVHVTRHPFDPDAPAMSADVPLLIGTCLHDSAYTLDTLDMDEASLAAAVQEMFPANGKQVLQAYRAAYPDTNPALLTAQIGSDRRLRGNAIAMCERKAAQGAAPVYAYRLDWQSQSYGGKFGAVHGTDVPLSLRNPDKWPLTGDGAEALTMANRLSAAWVAFAKTGNPSNAETPEWTAYDAASRATMIFNLDTRVENDPDGELLKLVGARKDAVTS